VSFCFLGTAITTWGISDSDSWLGRFDGPDEVGPLPLDRAWNPKPAWHAIRRALVEGRLAGPSDWGRR
jgi:endo-1,4-beta-xylanase